MANLTYDLLPTARLAGAMKRYIENGIPPGHFLTAILSNDLKEACARADDDHRYRLFDIVGWLYNEAPASCWGSPEKFEAWLTSRAAA